MKIRTNISLTEEQIKTADKLGEVMGLNRSQAIGQLLDGVRRHGTATVPLSTNVKVWDVGGEKK